MTTEGENGQVRLPFLRRLRGGGGGGTVLGK